MAKYNLNTNEASIVTSWLFEVDGYLDSAVNDVGVSARQALAATPTLDVTNWIRINIIGPSTDPNNWNECGLVWWIRVNDGVNVTPPTRPPEAVAWVLVLQQWRTSIDDAFVRVSEVARNANTVPITDIAGAVSTMPAGTNLIHQRSLVDKVLTVLV